MAIVEDYNLNYFDNEKVALIYNATATLSLLQLAKKNIVARCKIKGDME